MRARRFGELVRSRRTAGVLVGLIVIGAILRWVVDIPHVWGAAVFTFSAALLVCWVFYRRGWHNALLFTDPRVRRWFFAVIFAFELWYAIDYGEWAYYLFAAWFLGLYVSDTVVLRHRRVEADTLQSVSPDQEPNRDR